MPERPASRIVLASQSAARRSLLQAAGLEFSVVPSSVDEAAVRAALIGGEQSVEPADVAEILARAKAEDVSRQHPEALVTGGDQVLALGAALLGKPKSMDEARAMLLELRGRMHQLHSSVVLARDGEVVWTATDTAHLTMRSFSAAFVGTYLAQVGEAALSSVGGYQIEGLGVQLFERIEGDYFTILGLPLMPLLEELRRRDLLPS